MSITVQGSIPARAQLRVVPLAGAARPLDVAAAMADRARPAFLHGTWFGSRAILASDPVAWITGGGPDALTQLDAQPTMDSGGDVSSGAVGGGFLGSLGYGSLAAAAGAPFAMGFYDHLLRYDGAGWSFEMLWSASRADALDDALSRAGTLVAAPRPPAAPAPAQLVGVRWPDRGEHIRAVAAAQERIARGELYQANSCTVLTATLRGSALSLWRQLVEALDPSHAAYLPASSPTGASVGASPELFLRREGRTVRSFPIKGTRPRSQDPIVDAQSQAQLGASAKDRAENVMIVDLMRNDVGRVAVTGSVQVTQLLDVQAAAGVWHLVSKIEARLRDDVTDSMLLTSAFPPGSVTGAPKIAAMQAIAELESYERRLYTGAVGLLSPVQGVELAVVIRTFEIDEGQCRLGIGGGITEGSDPEAEYEECLVKARPLLRAGNA